jgi:recombination DNA repair RAD52 pathway protein
MGFSDTQQRALARELASRNVRTRAGIGRDLSYIEGWHAIAEANRIFGFDGWDRETLDSRCVVGRERAGVFLAVYIAKVRVTVRAHGVNVVREGNGTGEARDTSPGKVHDMALKAAETDATKRALATFGKPFGLSLYLSPSPSSTPRSRPTIQPMAASTLLRPSEPTQDEPATGAVAAVSFVAPDVRRFVSIIIL